MPDFFTALSDAASAAALAENLRGRRIFLYRGSVTRNNPEDPDKIARRCIKVTIPSIGITETYWIERINTAPAEDPALPPIGSTVCVGFYGGNPMDGC